MEKLRKMGELDPKEGKKPKPARRRCRDGEENKRWKCSEVQWARSSLFVLADSGMHRKVRVPCLGIFPGRSEAKDTGEGSAHNF